MNQETPNQILQQQEQYQAAVQHATKLLHSAIRDAQQAVSESFPSETETPLLPQPQQDLIGESIQNPSPLVDIVNGAFQKAKAILMNASLNVESPAGQEDAEATSLEPPLPVVPGFPDPAAGTPAVTQQSIPQQFPPPPNAALPPTAVNPTPPADLLTQNSQWMDSSMLQLFASMQNQTDAPEMMPPAPVPSRGEM